MDDIDIDPAQLAREPIILEKVGKEIGVVNSPDDYQTFAEWKKQTAPTDDFPPAWYAEQEAFQKLLPELLKTHHEKFVAVYQGQVVDSYDKEGELVYRVSLKYGEATPFFVDQVLETPRVYRILSAWIKPS